MATQALPSARALRVKSGALVIDRWRASITRRLGVFSDRDLFRPTLAPHGNIGIGVMKVARPQVSFRRHSVPAAARRMVRTT